MCVILACEDEFPKLQTLKDAEMMNPDGAGVAWLDDKSNIHFVKGIDSEIIKNMIDSDIIKLPCIIHFRITSVGKTIPQLTHPFIISEQSPLDMGGMLSPYSKGVFFHNGTIEDSKELHAEVRKDTGLCKVRGEKSDTRLMASILSQYPHKVLDEIDLGWNKYAVLDKDGIHRYGTWNNIEKGVKGSNNFFVGGYGSFSSNDEDNWFSSTPIKKTVYDSEDFEEYISDDFIDSEYISDEEFVLRSYDPRKIDSEIDSEITPNKQTQDDIALSKLFDTQAMNEANKKINHVLKSHEIRKYKKKDIRQMNIEFLKEMGWQKPERFSNKSLEKNVKLEQQLQIKKLEKLKHEAKLLELDTTKKEKSSKKIMKNIRKSVNKVKHTLWFESKMNELRKKESEEKQDKTIQQNMTPELYQELYDEKKAFSIAMAISNT